MMQIGGAHFKEQLMREVVAQARATPQAWLNSAELFDWMLDQAQADPEVFLDIVHVAVQLDSFYREDLERILELGGSVWRATEDGLARRVDPVAQEAYEQAAAAKDPVSVELREAWSRAYGRDPDPADAWDHAIKAVEAALRPIVCPNNLKATLSNIIGDLSSQGHLWRLGLRGRARDHSVAPLVEILKLMWPDPNRHGSPTPEPPATIEEARAVVHLAVTIVQWGRDGQVVRR
jgi:hypothetical protein